MYEFFLIKGQLIKNSMRGYDMETYAGVMKAGELVNRYHIPHRDFSKNTGYQRLPGKSRVNKLARDLKEGHVDLPTSLLLSVRDDNELRPVLEDGRYILSLPNNGDKPFYVVDGQHRLEALRKLIIEEQNEEWADYLIPVNIIFGSDENSEMAQFHTVNSNAKSIPTDLAFDLLKQRAKRDEVFFIHLNETRAGWKVLCQELTEKVAKHPGIWFGKIRFPNEGKRSTLIRSNAFASSLKGVVAQKHFTHLIPEMRVKVICAYWEGIARALPECFTGSPDKYNIQKTVGVYVFHDLLPTVLASAQYFHSPIDAPETYYGLLGATLQQLNGDNSIGTKSVGADFWKMGAEGASGAYSSGAGRRVLGQRIERELREDLNN